MDIPTHNHPNPGNKATHNQIRFTVQCGGRRRHHTLEECMGWVFGRHGYYLDVYTEAKEIWDSLPQKQRRDGR
jgi:hypothetical protein